MPRGRLVAVSVGPVRVIRDGERRRRTAIDKHPVDGPVRVTVDRLEGDGRGGTRVHGGPDHAVYAYAVEDMAWWADALQRPVGVATFGENLAVEGIDVSAAEPGEVWRVGTAVLQVAGPRLPCRKLELRMGIDGFLGRFGRAGRPGAYLRVLQEGSVRAGDEVVVEGRTGDRDTVADLALVRFGGP